MIKGIPVKLYERTASGTDTFGHPIYTEAPVTVEDVLVAPASTTEVLDMQHLSHLDIVRRMDSLILIVRKLTTKMLGAATLY